MNSHNAIRTGNFYVVIETFNSFPEHYAKDNIQTSVIECHQNIYNEVCSG